MNADGRAYHRPEGGTIATTNPKNQLALDLGDTTAKLSVRDLIVRGEIETPAPRARKPKPVPTYARDVYARDVYAHDGTRASSNDEQQSVSGHLALLERTYLVDAVAGWVPPSRSPKRMRTKPKRYLADPSLAVSLLGLSVESLLQDWQTFGLVFENLCMRDVDVYAHAVPSATFSPVCYYRNDSGLESDLIVELSDGRWAAIEAELSPNKVDQAASSLLRIRRKLAGDALARTRDPSFLAVLTGTGESAYQGPDGVYVIPVRTFGA